MGWWGDTNDWINQNSGWWGAAGAGLGVLGDISTAINNAGARSDQQRIFDVMADPAKLAAYTQGLYRPATEAQVGAIRRDISPQWAMMTGGATGGALNQFIADALAKFEAQRYQDASGTAVRALQGSLRAIPGQQPFQLGRILQSLAALRGIGGITRQPGIAPSMGGGYNPDPMAPEAQQGIPPASPLPTPVTIDDIQL